MNKNINYGVIASIILVVVLLIGGLVSYSNSNDLKSTIDEQKGALADKDNSLLSKDTEISNLATQVVELTKVPEELPTDAGVIETVVEKIGYLIDELFLDVPFEFKEAYSDREVTKLFDGKVDFKDDSYDAEETIKLSNMEIVTDMNDFEGVDLLTILKGDIEYRLTFENDLNVSEITQEDTLEFNFLGTEYEVTSWADNEITFTKGEEYIFKPLDGIDTITIDEKIVKVISVNDNGVFVEVDGVGKSIDVTKTRTVNGLEIQVKDCFESSNYVVAILKIATDVEETISSNTEYEEDSIWSWTFDNHSIGIVLNKDFDDRDEDGDEEFPALAKNESICLPNDYVCVKYNGLGEEDREEYSFDLYDDNKYVRVEGNFQSGTKDYEKIYVNSSGIFDKEDGEYVLIGGSIDLGDTDFKLVVNVINNIITIKEFGIDSIVVIDEDGNSINIPIEELGINFGLTEIDGETYDYEYMNNDGIIVSNTDDLADHKEFEISVPEERVYSSLLVY